MSMELLSSLCNGTQQMTNENTRLNLLGRSWMEAGSLVTPNAPYYVTSPLCVDPAPQCRFYASAQSTLESWMPGYR